MEKDLYSMIFKRKSFHIFRDIGSIDSHELQSIEEAYKTFTPLVSDIKTAIKIVPADETTCKRGQEYCILLYSEKEENYLQNMFNIFSFVKESSTVCILKFVSLEFTVLAQALASIGISTVTSFWYEYVGSSANAVPEDTAKQDKTTATSRITLSVFLLNDFILFPPLI